MKKIAASVSFCLLVFSLLATSGCETVKVISPGDVVIPNPRGDAPTYAQNEEAMILDEFKIRIDRAYWTNKVMKPGWESLAALPDSFRKQQEDQLTAKPSAVFLMVEFTVTNTGNRHGSFPGPPVFVLENAKKVRYAPTDILGLDYLTAKSRRSTINPGQLMQGIELFDVPKDDYLMRVSIGTWRGSGYYEGKPVFKWILKPTE